MYLEFLLIILKINELTKFKPNNVKVCIFEPNNNLEILNTQISIIGCGWLGLPLAKLLVENGFIIKGSTTSKAKLASLKQYHIQPYVITLNPSGITGPYVQFLAGSDTVIINIPPGLRKNPSKNHVAEVEHLIQAIEETQSIKNVLYISSTSVFKDTVDFPIITAETPPNATSDSAKQLIKIEQMLQASSSFNTTILRFGGLIGETRHPAKFLAGRTNISNPKAPINLIHKTDCLAIILSTLKNSLWNQTLNAAYPSHPNKKEYYTNYCKQNDLAVPHYSFSEESEGKIIDSSSLVQLLDYNFKETP